MRILTVALLFSSFYTVAFAQSKPAARPHITGVDHAAFYTTAPDGVRKLYTEVLGLSAADPIEPGESMRYLVGKQWVGFSPAPDPKATDRMDHVAFATDNIVALRRYLTDKGFTPSQIQGKSDHSLSFTADLRRGRNDVGAPVYEYTAATPFRTQRKCRRLKPNYVRCLQNRTGIHKPAECIVALLA